MWHIYKISFLYSFLPPFIKNWPSRLECQKQRELPWEPSITDTAVTVVCRNPPTLPLLLLDESTFPPSPSPQPSHWEWTQLTLLLWQKENDCWLTKEVSDVSVSSKTREVLGNQSQTQELVEILRAEGFGGVRAFYHQFYLSPGNQRILGFLQC